MANLPIVNKPYKSIQGLRVAYATATTVTVASGRARDSGNTNDITLDASVTINTANNGANGLDTGTIANDTLYALYLVGDSTGYKDTCAMISTDTTSPLYPTGYDMCRRIARVLTNGAAQILPFDQTGESTDRVMEYRTPIAELTNGASDSFADVDLASSVPAVKTRVRLLAAITPSAAGRGVYVRMNGSAATDGNDRLNSVVNAVEQFGNLEVICDSSAIIEYKVDNAGDSVDLSVVSYVDSL